MPSGSRGYDENGVGILTDDNLQTAVPLFRG
jgi:hypothetical protein